MSVCLISIARLLHAEPMMVGGAGLKGTAIEEEPIEELGRSSEAEPICQDCPAPGALAPGDCCIHS